MGGNRDKFSRNFHQILENYLGPQCSRYVDFSFEDIEGKTVCVVGVTPCLEPVFVAWKEKGVEAEEFYCRRGPASVPLNKRETVEYVQRRQLTVCLPKFYNRNSKDRNGKLGGTPPTSRTRSKRLPTALPVGQSSEIAGLYP